MGPRKKLIWKSGRETKTNSRERISLHLELSYFLPLSKPVKAYSVAEATKRLERYCAYQERCHKEVSTKLRELRMIPQAIDQIMAHLIQENYLNEERFARSFARGKFKVKKWGRNRIVNELKQRDISVYNIRAALTEIDTNTYLETLDQLALKRLLSLKESDNHKKRKKLADFLLYRGWESHLVYEKVRELVP